MKKQCTLFLLAIALGSAVSAQSTKITLSGIIKDAGNKSTLPFVNVVLKKAGDSSFAAGTISGEDGRFVIRDIVSGNYLLTSTYIGYKPEIQPVTVGQLSSFLDLGIIELVREAQTLNEVTLTSKQEAISSRMDKKTFTLANNISQTGGSALEAMKNLPGITIQDGKIQLRGSEKVMILIDGKQTALTGFGSQSGLENIPASAIEKIEIINNPSSRYDANGNAGIVNIIFKKEKKRRF